MDPGAGDATGNFAEHACFEESDRDEIRLRIRVTSPGVRETLWNHLSNPV